MSIDISYKTTKYVLDISFKDGNRKIINEILVEGTKETITVTSDAIYADTYIKTFYPLTSDTSPSVVVEDLTIRINSNATTMKLKNIPLGDGDYEIGTVYDENGFLKIKR